MGKITLTSEEKAELESNNVLIQPHEGAVRPGMGTYHNPVTGKEIIHPVDPYHLMKRLRQGWKLGSAPSELKEKLGIALPDNRGAEEAAPAPVPEETDPEGVQLPLWGSDATPETDIKLIVSEASRPVDNWSI